MLNKDNLNKLISELETNLTNTNSDMCEILIEQMFNADLGDQTADSIRTLCEFLQQRDDLIIKTLKLIIENLK